MSACLKHPHTGLFDKDFIFSRGRNQTAPPTFLVRMNARRVDLESGREQVAASAALGKRKN
jgi:hypothetical protein